MRMYDIIHKKRGGGELDREEIAWFVRGFTDGEIPDYQAAALCMAIYFKGMTKRETVALTECMAESGDKVDLSRFGDLSADKHSTGGVGDKTTLIIAPIIASLGGKMAKMSGRGLGHTGGTVDKLESIPGYRTSLSPAEFLEQVEKIGIAVIGQSGNLTPADKKLYALRDVTATVDSIPLITSSIMSKKLAAGSKNIVLDVKVGSGAFMKTLDDAEVLAKNMVDIGKSCGRNVVAVLTNMDVPLGSAVGNTLEIIEAVDILRGVDRGDAGAELRDVCLILATQLLAITLDIAPYIAEDLVEEALSSGKAFGKMKEWIAAQGGDVRYLEDTSLFSRAEHEFEVSSPEDGFITAMDAELIGDASVILGAGRAAKEDTIDHAAGVIIEKRTGDFVRRGDVILRLYTNKKEAIPAAAETCLKALSFGAEAPNLKGLIFNIID